MNSSHFEKTHNEGLSLGRVFASEIIDLLELHEVESLSIFAAPMVRNKDF